MEERLPQTTSHTSLATQVNNMSATIAYGMEHWWSFCKNDTGSKEGEKAKILAILQERLVR